MSKSESDTTRPLTDEQWMYWQKLVSDEHDTQAAEIERLRAFVQWAADHSNDPAIVREAKEHGAKP